MIIYIDQYISKSEKTVIIEMFAWMVNILIEWYVLYIK